MIDERERNIRDEKCFLLFLILEVFDISWVVYIFQQSITVITKK